MPEKPEAPLILIADDSEDDLFFARRLLEKAGIGSTVVGCTDGSDLVALLQRRAEENKPPPRAVFLDVKMPGLDGFETLKWIRRQEHLRHVCVVMLSGSGEERDVQLARSLGADDYLVKYPPASDFLRVLTAAGC